MIDLLALGAAPGGEAALAAALRPVLACEAVYKVGCGIAGDCRKLAAHHPAAFAVVAGCLDLSAMWRSHSIEQSESCPCCLCLAAAYRRGSPVLWRGVSPGVPAQPGGLWPARAASTGAALARRQELFNCAQACKDSCAPTAARCPARPCPSPGRCPAGGKRSTAGYRKRAGEVSLSALAQTVLGKPLDKSCQARCGPWEAPLRPTCRGTRLWWPVAVRCCA